LPASITRLQNRITKLPGGERQFVTILAAIPLEGLEAVIAACEMALQANVITSDYVLNLLSRAKPQPKVIPVALPQDLQLKTEPQANTMRYDQLLKNPTAKSLAVVMAAAALAAQAMLEVGHGTA
jgi:ABC-type dipeptide/oligopeptide/nickel transport system ATPase subunit